MRDGKQILQHTAIPGIRGQIRMQINFGVSTGINGIPTAITIQRGNTQDKKNIMGEDAKGYTWCYTQGFSAYI